MKIKLITYALFLANPASEPPFVVELGFNTREMSKIDDCKHIPDAIEKIKNFCKENDLTFSDNFTLLFPIFMNLMDTDYESTMHYIASLIKGEADKNNWKFDRIGGYTGKTQENFIQ